MGLLRANVMRCLRAWMRHRDGGCWRMRAGHRPIVRSTRRGHGAEPIHEGRPFHLHAHWYGFLGVPRDRCDPDCGIVALLRMSLELMSIRSESLLAWLGL